MSSGDSYRLKIGETAKVRFAFIKTSETIVYAGMLNDLIYSVAVSWSFGNNSLAYNLYIPKDHKEFYTRKGKVQVEYVSPEEIRFTYQET